MKECPLIVKSHPHAVLHADKDKILSNLMQEALDKGKIQLPGRRAGGTGPRPEMPDKLSCLFQEFMNHGSVQDWMDKELLDRRRMLAVMRSVAGALAYMHQRGMTHNDIKPENVMLKRDAGEQFIAVKLGDLGLARATVDQSADFSQYGMTVFCMITKEHFGARKFQPEVIDQFTDEVSKLVKAQLMSAEGKPEDTLISLSKVPGQLKKIWREQVTMAQIESFPPLQGWQFHPSEG